MSTLLTTYQSAKNQTKELIRNVSTQPMATTLAHTIRRFKPMGSDPLILPPTPDEIPDDYDTQVNLTPQIRKIISRQKSFQSTLNDHRSVPLTNHEDVNSTESFAYADPILNADKRFNAFFAAMKKIQPPGRDSMMETLNKPNGNLNGYLMHLYTSGLPLPSLSDAEDIPADRENIQDIHNLDQAFTSEFLPPFPDDVVVYRCYGSGVDRETIEHSANNIVFSSTSFLRYYSKNNW